MNPLSLAAQATNALALAVGGPPGLIRALWSRDEFQSAEGSEVMYASHDESLWMAFWDRHPQQALQDSTLAVVRSTWENTHCGASSRIDEAMQFYYYAWTAPSLEVACVNLAIALELLFAPRSAGETTHQIAFAVARFCGGTVIEQAGRYDEVKRFYGLRSAVVHGRRPAHPELLKGLLSGFDMVSLLLRTIVTDQQMRSIFASENGRIDFLRAQMFSASATT